MMAWERYERWLKSSASYSPVTISGYVCIARQYDEMARGDYSIDTITQFLSRYQDERSVNFAKAALKSFLRFVGRHDLAAMLRTRRIVKELEWWWTKDEIRRIIEACEDDRELIMVTFGYFQAMRRKEIASVHVSDIDFENERVRVRLAKRGPGVHFSVRSLYRRNEFGIDQVELLRRYITSRALKPSDRLLPITTVRMNQIFRDVVERAGVRPAGLHMLRHSRIAHLREAGVELDVIARWIGHTSLDTTMLYAHIGPQKMSELIPVP